MIEVMGRRLFVDRDLNLLQCLRSLLAMAMGMGYGSMVWYASAEASAVFAPNRHLGACKGILQI